MSIIADSIAKIGIGYNPQAIAAVGFFGQKQQEGRSGYWRLFFTQMQEDALKPKAAEKPPRAFKEPYVLEEKSDGSVDVVFGKKKVAKVTTEELQEAKQPTPRPLTQRLPETTIFESARLVAQVQLMLVQYTGHNIALKKQKVVVTDDDEEDDIELLLLAA